MSISLTNGPGLPGDCILLYPIGANDFNYIDWRFVNGTQSIQATGTSNGTVSFPLPLTPGEYEFRMFANQTWQRVAITGIVTARYETHITVNGVAAPTATVARTGSIVSVSVTGAPGFTGDDIGLYQVGANDYSWVDWRFLNGTQVRPDAGHNNATVSFPLPITPGDYEFRVFANQSFQRAAVSSTITATADANIAAYAAPRERYGIVAGWDGNIAAKLSDLGIGLLRTPCTWAQMEDSRGHFTWDQCADPRINGAANAGYQVLLTVQCTPAWARTGGDCNTQPDNMSDWYDFVVAFMDRYHTKNVVLGIYNEPDITTEGAAMSPVQYCGYAATAMQARDDHSPGFRLAMPETSDHASTNGWFSDAMGCISSGLRSQDVIAVHWYTGGVPFPAYLDYVRSISGGSNDVWLSETGYPASDPVSQASFYNARLSDFEFVALTRPWWKKIIFYSLYDGTESDPDGIVNANQTTRLAYSLLKSYVIATTVPSMGGNQSLAANGYITSYSGNYYLMYRSDGNLALYDADGTYAGWSTGTNGASIGQAILQNDGNLVVFDATHDVWASATDGHNGAYLIVQDSGAIWIFDADGTPIWYR